MRSPPPIAGALALLALTTLPAPGQAQTVQRVWDGPYLPISQLAGRVGPVQSIVFADRDNAFTNNLNIGWNYRFLGAVTPQFGVSTNGFVGFIPSTLPSATNSAPGDVSQPAGLIAPWWDDLNLGSASLAASYATLGASPNRVLVIEVDNFSAAPQQNDGGSWQVWLYESPVMGAERFDVRVAGSLSNDYTATTGYESVFTTPSGSFLPCASTAACTAANFATMVGKVYTVLDSPRAELTGELVSVPTGGIAAQASTATVRIRNLGRTIASGVEARVILSDDVGGNIAVKTLATLTGLSVGANRSVTRNVSLTVPPNTPSGEYFLTLVVDPQANVNQAFTQDDRILHDQPFVVGFDLEPTAVIPGSSGANSGRPLRVDVDITQRGAPFTGNVEVRVFASSDEVLDMQDAEIGRVTASLGGTSPQRVAVNGTVPTLNPGMYHVIAVVDRPGAVTEVNEFNNTLTSAARFDVGPDFQVDSVTAPVAGAPGTAVNVTSVFGSRGVPFTGTVIFRLALSTDQTYDMTDPSLGTFIATFAGQTTITDTRQPTIPMGVPPGKYFVLSFVDEDNRYAETVESNNIGATANRLLTHVDLIPQNVTVPSSVRPGAMVRFTAEVAVEGPGAPSAVPYRIVLSDDARLDASDIDLGTGQVALSGAVNTIDQMVTIPANIQVRQWRILLVVDPNGAVVESDETNNTLASGTPVQVEGPDLTVTSVDGLPFAFIGRNYQLRIGISNTNGSGPANGSRYAVFLSDNPVIVTTDRRLFVSQPIDVPGGSSRSFVANVSIPADLPPATGRYLGVIADVFTAVPEINEGNNVLRLDGTVDIVEPSPDLLGEIFLTPSRGAPGESIGIARLLSNQGVLDSPQFSYVYVLSTDAVIDGDDLVVGRRQGSLQEKELQYGNDVLQLPASVPAGTYTLGMIIDPDDEVNETDESNNIVTGPSIDIVNPSIQFAGTTLPRATVGVEYEAGIFATGSPVPLTMTIIGTEPGGLRFDRTTGILSGVPDTEGIFTFSVRATAAGQAYLEQAFKLRVAPPTLALTITSTQPPTAVAQRPYRFALSASGGVGQYTWTVTSTASLPGGTTLTERGVLAGTPRQRGEFDFEVTVTDELEEAVTTTMKLFVVNARQVVTIRKVDLPIGIVGAPYCADGPVRLRADRGLAPVRWTIESGGVPGLVLDQDGRLCGTPEQAGRFPLAVRVTDRTQLFDVARIVVRVEDDSQLAVASTLLPDAIVGEAYSTFVQAVRGAPPYRFTLAEGQLPDGLMLDPTGEILGTATSTGTYPFIIEARDTRDVSTVRSLSIDVTFARSASESCACQSSGRSGDPTGGPAGSALAFLGLMLALRLATGRRGRRRAPQRIARTHRRRKR